MVYFALLVNFIAVVFGFLAYQYLQPQLKVFFFYTLCSLIVQSAGRLLGFYEYNNYFLFNYYILIDFWLAIIVVWDSFKKYKSVLKLTAVVFTFYLIIALVIKGNQSFYSTGLLVSAAILVITYFLALIHLLTTKTKITTEPEFWCYVSMLVFYGSNIPLFGVFNHFINKNWGVALNLYVINDISNIVRYTLISMAFYQLYKSNKFVAKSVANDR